MNENVTSRQSRGKRGARTGIAVLSVISLALGSAAHLPGPARAAEADAAEESGSSAKYTGGLFGADGKGVMQGSDLIASDIGARSCTVTGTSQKFSKAGFKVEIEEPRITSDDKRQFAVMAEFSGDKQRTFRDWLITGSNNNAPLQKHDVEAKTSAEGTPWTPTAQAEEVLSISKVGRSPLTATIAPILTRDKIAQYAKATADSPVRYVWADKYKEDSTEPAKQIFANPYISVSVNPWPSENDNCSPVTVDWENIKTLVIDTDEKVNVGQIHADANSLSRMVVEAHDQAGNLLGTSNAKVSGVSGGTENIGIDQDGNITFTPPEYVGKKSIAGDQNITFTVVAQPRAGQQLMDAVPKNEVGVVDIPVVDEGESPAGKGASNSLPRYSKPNLVSSNSITLDDTKYHDPEYDAADKAIISGTESETGPVTNERQSVTFTTAGDKIADLVKKKVLDGNNAVLRKDNNNATVKLDKRYVYEGWDVTMDPETYDVTVTAPKDPKPGTFAQPRVIVTYSNGSTDMIPLLVLVDPNNTQVTELVPEPESATGVQGAELTSQVKYTPVVNGYDAVKPAKFSIDPASIPEGWEVTIDEDGNVTAKSPEDAPNNSHANVKVLAEYPDGTTDETSVDFQVRANVKVPDYQAVTGKPSDPVSLTPIIPNIGIGGEESDEAPSRYSFPDGGFTYSQGDWTLKIDENTGEVTSNIPDGALPGASLTFPVTSYYGSGATPQTATGTINVIGENDGEDAASYAPRQTKPGVAVTSDITTQLKDPSKAKYKLPDKKYWPKGWDFAIDDNGTVTATPDSSVPDGATADIPVTVTYPDGSSATVPAEFGVVSTASGANNPNYPTVHVKAGEKAKSTVDTTYVNEAYEPKYSLITDPNDSSYIPLPRNLTWDDVSIDENTGEVTTKVSKNAKPGTSAQIPVRVKYNDGSSDVTSATVVVKAEARQVHEPTYNQKVTKPGEIITSEPLADTMVPKQDLKDEQPYSVPAEIDGWKISVDNAGKVTAVAPADAKAGDSIDVPVTVTYYDGSKDVVYAPFVVRENRAELFDPNFPVESTTPGASVSRAIAPTDLPKGTTYSFGKDGDTPITETEENGWKYTIDPDTGKVTVTPSPDAKPGDKQTKNAVVNYPDGSTDEAPVTTVVNLTQNFEAEPTYPSERVYPGERTTSPLTVEKPEGLEGKDFPLADTDPYKIRPAKNFTDTGDVNEFGNSVYSVATANGNWLVSLDDKGNVLAQSPETAKPGDAINVPVTVKYADGSTDKVTAPIAVVDRPTRPVPFDVKYEYDPNVPAGTYEVVTEGKSGSEALDAEGKWNQTEAPVTEVVKVGTKQAQAGDTVTWTVPLQYNTELRENRDLKPGETKVVQEGVRGEKTFTATFTAQGDQAETADSETTTEPVTEIIEYGPDLKTTELVTTTTKPVEFEVEVIEDPELEAGTWKVEEGELGEDTLTSTQKLVDGEPSGEPTVTTERTKEPKKQIIRVGTKQPEQPDQPSSPASVSLPFTTIVEFDDTLPAGEQKEKQAGKDGKGVVENGELKITDPATPRVIVVGTKQATDPSTDPEADPENQAPKDYSWTESTAFDVEIRENPDLPKGEKRVVRDGERGEETHTVHFELKDGVYTPQETTEVTKEPVNKIVEIGTKGDTPTEPTQPGEPQETEQSVVAIERLPFDTEVIEDPTLEAGQVVVDKPGAPGKQQTVTTQKFKDGKPTGEPTSTSTVLVEPENRVLRVGTKQPAPTSPEQPEEPTTPASVSLPFTTIVEFDDTLPAGEQREKQPGQDGTGVVENGELKITKPATPRVIVVGTKQATDPSTDPETAPETQAPKDYSWTESTAFDVEIRENPDLPEGEKRVVQDGERGEETHTVHFELKDGVYSPEETTEVTKEPVNKIVEIGTKEDTPTEPTQPGEPAEPQETEQSVVTIERLPFDTEVIEDPTLEAGQVVVDKPGAPGKQQTVTTQKYTDGKPTGEPTSTSTVLVEPENRVLRIGTKPAETPEVKSVTTDLPFGTKVIFDPSLDSGTTETVTKGVPGRVTVTGTDVERVEPKAEVLRIGTKPVAGATEAPEEVSWEEPLPFEVIVKQNPDKPRGSVEEITQGENGTQKRGVRYEIVDGKPVPKEFTEVITPATDHVIEVGTGDDETEISEVNETALPFETEIIEDPTLPAGSVFTEQHGQQGSQRTTRTWKLVDGHVTGDPTVSTETITEPTNRILRVGTGDPHTGEQAKPEERPYYPPVILGKGATERVELAYGHIDGDRYELGEVPEGWDIQIDEATGAITATSPADVEPGTIVTVPVTVTRADGSTIDTFAKIGVNGEQSQPGEPGEPGEPGQPTEPTQPTQPTEPTVAPGADGSSEKFQRCVANAFAANSPLLWLVPIGLLAAVGGPLSEQFGPQINQAFGEINGQINRKIRENTPDLPDVGMGGHNKPEWYRELEAQADAVNRRVAGLQQQYAGVGEQLRPLGIGLAVIGAAALGIALINQACKPEGFDGWSSSTKDGNTGSSSKDGGMTTVRPEGTDEPSSVGGSANGGSSKDGNAEK